MSGIASQLKKLSESSRAAGLFSLAAAAAATQTDPDDLDNQINLVGALHEVGKLRNSLEPYWRAWRTHESPWIERALARLRERDHDYWALASLLGCKSTKCIAGLSQLGLSVRALRFYQRYDLPDVHLAVVARPKTDRIWAPVFEIGHDSASGEVVDVARFRAVSWERLEETDGAAIGHGSGSYFLRAVLPNGSWRMVSAPFDLTPEAALAR
jgi:hypothetical protein